MSTQLIPNCYDVLNSKQSSRWLRRVLREVLASGRNPNHVAQDARLLADVLDARAEDWRNGCLPDAANECHVAMVDLFLPLFEAEASEQAGSAPLVTISFPAAAWRANDNTNVPSSHALSTGQQPLRAANAGTSQMAMPGDLK